MSYGYEQQGNNQYGYDQQGNNQYGYDQQGNNQYGGYPQTGYDASATTASNTDWYQTDYQTPSITQTQPVAPLNIPSARTVTSVGFDYPVSDTDTNFGVSGGFIGGRGSNNTSRFGISTYEGEPPLLVELGIDFRNIAEKTRSALLPTKTLEPALMADGDIAGPFVFCFTLGFFLMLTGKLHFGYVFGFGVTGCIAIHTILNLMTDKETGIEIHVVFSVLGYALLPIVFLAFVAIFLPLKGTIGWVLVPPSVGWCTLTATRFFVAALAAEEQRYLIAYPAFLFFACFALITVF